MQHAGWVVWFGAIGLTVGATVGCGDHVSRKGSAAAGGEGGVSGSAVQGGGGGTNHANACDSRTVCEDSPSAFLACPITLQDYVPDCSIYGGIRVERYDAECGGTVIMAMDGIQTETWTFTPAGKLVGTTWFGDVGDSGCWGAPCATVGSPEVLCDWPANDGGAGGAGG